MEILIFLHGFCANELVNFNGECRFANAGKKARIDLKISFKTCSSRTPKKSWKKKKRFSMVKKFAWVSVKNLKVDGERKKKVAILAAITDQ